MSPVGGEYLFSVRCTVEDGKWWACLYRDGTTEELPQTVATIINFMRVFDFEADTELTRDQAMHVICKLARAYRRLEKAR